MRRRIFTTLSVMSLFMFLITAAQVLRLLMVDTYLTVTWELALLFLLTPIMPILWLASHVEKRRLSSIVSAISLMLCLATGVLWVRSYWTLDYLSKHSSFWLVMVTSERGRLDISTSRYQQPLQMDIGYAPIPEGLLPPKLDYDPGWSPLGFDVVNVEKAWGHTVAVGIPHWFASVFSAVLPVRWFWKWRRDRLAKRKGLCPQCGYDLRATPNRCPECGTVIPAQTASGE